MSKDQSRDSLIFLIKILAAVLLSVMGIAALFGTAGAYLSWLAARDAKLLAMHDQAFESKLAVHCGKKGTLVRDVDGKGHACMYVNRDGEVLLQPIPSAPLLAGRVEK